MRIIPFLKQNLWPLLTGVGILGIARGFVIIIYRGSKILLGISKILLLIIAYVWWRDIAREFNKGPNILVKILLKYGIIFFIVSEIIFFFSFFWALFRTIVAPTVEIGSIWPPLGISVINAFHLPLLNTIILLTSGITVRWSHYSIFTKNLPEAIISLFLTIVLGAYFTVLQITEYLTLSFRISDSVYGTLFFVVTGFHGLHVIIGTLFLIVIWIRLYLNQCSPQHHTGFELAAWYWHFVDVVWLFLFICLYWWAY